MGRPIELDDLKAKRIVDAIANGCSQAGAAKAAGIAPSTFQEWLARGRDGEAPFREFAERVSKARGSAECTVVAKLWEKINEGYFPAIQFWLDRRCRAEWGEAKTVASDKQVTGEQTNANHVEMLESLLAAAKSRAA